MFFLHRSNGIARFRRELCDVTRNIIVSKPLILFQFCAKQPLKVV